MDKGGESDETSGVTGVRVVDARKSPSTDKSGGASDRPSAVERTVDKRGITGDGGPEVKDKNGNSSDIPPDEVDDGVVSEGRNKIFRLEGAIYSIDVSHFIQKDLLIDLINSKSIGMFKRFQISTQFLTIDPVNWNNHKEYIIGKHIINSLKIVNDTADRVVKLIEEYNKKFTKNEEQKQHVLQIVQDYRKKYPQSDRKR